LSETQMKRWRGIGRFYCPRMTDFNGRTRTIRGIEAEDKEKARPLIQAEVVKSLGLSPVETFLNCVTVDQVKEMKGLDRQPKKRGTPARPLKKSASFLS
jgi:hypothetical protein